MTSPYLERTRPDREIRAGFMLLAECRRGRLSAAEIDELRAYLRAKT